MCRASTHLRQAVEGCGTIRIMCPIQGECAVPSNLLRYAVPHNNRCTLLLENVSLYFGLIFLYFLVHYFIFFSPLSHALFHTIISERDCTPVQCFFYKNCTQSNQQLALSRLMHSTHRCSAVFPYQALETRPAQETLIGCADCITSVLRH
jgi:hypothetical protein